MLPIVREELRLFLWGFGHVAWAVHEGSNHEVWKDVEDPCPSLPWGLVYKEVPCSLELGDATRFWIKSWSKKETCWETCLENTAVWLMKLGIAGTCLTKHGLVRDAWDAELWPGMLSCGFLLFWKMLPLTVLFWNWPVFWILGWQTGPGLCVLGCFKGSEL